MHPRFPTALPSRLIVCAAIAGLGVLCSAGVVHAQKFTQAASVAALARYGSFYADKTVTVRGQLRDANGRVWLEDEAGSRVAAAYKGGPRPDGTIDATGVLWDLGRMKPADPLLAAYDLTRIVGTGGEQWPKPGEVYVFAVSRFAPADVDSGVNPGGSTIRSLVLEGPRAVGRQVTVVGQFSGRNLFGDLPRSPGVSRWDFVLRSEGASIWVTGRQPRGKDFDFNPDQRIDSNRWLEVTGTVRDNDALTCIEASKLTLSKQPASTVAEPVQPKAIKPFPPPEVVFSIPAEGETDVSPTVAIRIQLSRGVDRASLVSHVRIGYVGAAPGSTPPIQSTADLEERNDAPGGAIAVLTIRFAQPLERFRTVQIELLEGIKAPDGQMLKPWKLTFSTGG
jgi:hypothetical protein